MRTALPALVLLAAFTLLMPSSAVAAPPSIYNLGGFGGTSGIGFGVNDAGQVAGASYSPGDLNQHAFHYDGTPGAGGVMRDLGTLGGTNSIGWGVNSAGQVAGYSDITADATERAFRYDGTPGAGGIMRDLGTLGGTDSIGWSVNDAGQVAGYSTLPGDATERAFRYDGTPGAGGVMRDLGTLGGTASRGYGINDAGHVAGSSWLAGDTTFHAILSTGTPGAGGQMIDLEAWLNANNPVEGTKWLVEEAYDISNTGWITGYGTYDPDGPGGVPARMSPFLLDASSLVVPEPSGLALVGVAVSAFLRRRPRRQCARSSHCETLEPRRLLSLSPAVSYAVGSNPQAIAAADFNNDGRADLVTSNASDNTISLRLGNGAGGFAAAANFATTGSAGATAASLAIADFNKDGKLDVATVQCFQDPDSYYWGNLSVLRGNGDGTFQAAIKIVGGAIAVAAGDFNADGNVDLVVSGDDGNSFGLLQVLRGNGTGGFVYSNPHQLLNSPSNVVEVGDINGDGKLDAMVLLANGWPVMGNGDGTFDEPDPWSKYEFFTPWVARRVGLGDFTGDGKLDAIFAGDTVSIHRGHGDGFFDDAITHTAPGTYQTGLATGDLNADGKLDAITTSNTGKLNVLLGNGNGSLRFGGSFDIGASPSAVAVADFNGDGRLDVAAANGGSNNVSVLLNDGNWSPLPPSFSISDATVTEGNAGTVNAVFTVTLQGTTTSSVSVDYSTADIDDLGVFTATAGVDYTATSGTLTFAPGQTTKTIAVQIKGDRIGEPDEQFNVNLTSTTNGFIIHGTGVGVIIDDEPRISINTASATEGNSGTTPMTFTVSLSAASDQSVTVDYHTADTAPLGYPPATPAVDYDRVSGTLTFLPGQTSKTFSVPVRGDLIDENDEYLFTYLTNTTNAYYLHDGVGTIIDDDTTPSIAVSNVSRAEGNSGTTPFQFTVSLTAPAANNVSVQYATASGTATSSTQGGRQDYQPTSGTVTFAPGETSKTVTVNVNGDTRGEGDETFFLNLSNATNATIADAQGLATILDDETRGKNWIGPASGGSWSTAANWSPSGVPGPDSLVTISGASVLLSASANVSELFLGGSATLTLASNGNRLLRTGGLYEDAAARLNLNDNDLIIDYSGSTPMSDVFAKIVAGLSASPLGIYSSLGNGSGGTTTLGLAEASQALGINGAQTAIFSGQTVDATTVLIKYTYAGDANLDGVIDGGDYGIIDNFIQVSNAFGYFNGDFNYDGVIDGGDYGILDNNIQAQGAAL